MRHLLKAMCAAAALGPFWFLAAASSNPPGKALTGQAAFQDYTQMRPGTFRKITVGDLPQPYATPGAGNGPTMVARPANAWPQTVPGFKVELFSDALKEPREIRTAPNGDEFVAESSSGRITVLRGITAGDKAAQTSVFLTGLHMPFGMAFFPAGP